MDVKVSVIVPIYNVEKYICQCLDSIVNQTYKNLEIILIDDGSPDRCGVICDEYSAHDERIRVLHKKNEGLSAAWNDGITMATGDWVMFVDSDDWLDLNYVETLVKTPQADGADIIQSGGYYWEESRGRFIRWAFLEPFVYDKNDQIGKDRLKILALLRPNDPRTKGTVGFTWGKLFRRSFLEEERFQFDIQIRAGLMMDVLFDWDAFEKASRILGVVFCGYHYRITKTSGTYKFDPNLPKEYEYIETLFYQRAKKENASPNIYYAIESRCLRDVVHSLQRYYFHPDNSSSHKEVAIGISSLKQMPHYKDAIASKKNPYNSGKLKVFQIALRFPFILPLRALVCVWALVDKKEKTA